MLLNYNLIQILAKSKCAILKYLSVSLFNKRKYCTNGKYDIVFPQKSRKRKFVGDNIIKPSYWKSGLPEAAPSFIERKNETQIKAIKNSCRLASNILKSLQGFLKEGMTTDDIDDYVHNLCIENGAYPSPLNYHHFPKSVCTSVNNVACHGIPDSRPLKNGDIVNVDITVYREFMHGDCSGMFIIGNADKKGLDLCSTTQDALLAGISVCKPGRPFSEIGKVIEKIAEEKHYTVVPSFLGHGIGSYFHGLPDIYHFDTTGTEFDSGHKMEPGMTFTIEPIFSEGTSEIIILEDNWTAVTSDKSRTAQWEHTVLITNDGVQILTN